MRHDTSATWMNFIYFVQHALRCWKFSVFYSLCWSPTTHHPPGHRPTTSWSQTQHLRQCHIISQIIIMIIITGPHCLWNDKNNTKKIRMKKQEKQISNYDSNCDFYSAASQTEWPHGTITAGTLQTEIAVLNIDKCISNVLSPSVTNYVGGSKLYTWNITTIHNLM